MQTYNFCRIRVYDFSRTEIGKSSQPPFSKGENSFLVKEDKYKGLFGISLPFSCQGGNDFNEKFKMLSYCLSACFCF